MGRHDEKWLQILKRIEEQKGKMISQEEEEQMAWDLELLNVKAWKEQLMQGLETFTTGDAKGLVIAADERNVFSTWSRMADKGHSLREKHVMAMRRKAMSPKSSVSAKDLELAIILWEKEILRFEEASNETFDVKNKIMLITDMLRPTLRQRI